MDEHIQYLINKFLNNSSYDYKSLREDLKKIPFALNQFKECIIKDEKSESHALIIQCIVKRPIQERKEMLEEVCKIHRKPFLIYKFSLSRVFIVTEETYLYIFKNDRRFFNSGPELTSVDMMVDQLSSNCTTFYPSCFSNSNHVRDQDIYDALVRLEDERVPPLVTTTKLHPGTGAGQRRRKRYCLSDDGLDQIVYFLSFVIRDELENFNN